MPDEITHACPPDGSGLTPCCGRTPVELPRTDRITSQADAVTCPGRPCACPNPPLHEPTCPATGDLWRGVAPGGTTNTPLASVDRIGCDIGCDHGDPCGDCLADMAPELTAEEARALVDELGADLYRAQDALDFVAECCDIADREARPVTTAHVREWLKGARCGRQLAADGVTPRPRRRLRPAHPRRDQRSGGDPVTEPSDNPPGSTREQLASHILAAIDNHLNNYTSTACSTATACQAARHTDPRMTNTLLGYAIGLHDRCPRTQKFTGQPCVCGCHAKETP